jgi:hypothetical protein
MGIIPTFTLVTARLKILGGPADVGNFPQATYADPNDVAAEVTVNRAQNVAYKLNEGLIIGESGADHKSFDDLHSPTVDVLPQTGETLRVPGWALPKEAQDGEGVNYSASPRRFDPEIRHWAERTPV